MYTREGITGSNPVLSATKRRRMKKKTFILIFVLWFILGILYVSLVDKGEKEEQKITGEQEKEIFEFDTLQTINDSITIRQIRQMDSLHAAGKL
jgi:hypothetical protein